MGQGFQKFKTDTQTATAVATATATAHATVNRCGQHITTPHFMMVIENSEAMPLNPHTGEGYVASPQRLILCRGGLTLVLLTRALD